jgi:DNA-binding NarL/FixJ family response regulator
MSWILLTIYWIRDIFKGWPNLSYFDKALSRDTLITRGRTLLIDDVVSPVLTNLKKKGFSIEHDKTGNNTNEIERHRYDVIILDFGNVGKSYGPDEGLSLLRHIKRISPATFVLAFTSLSLYSKQAEFYTLSDGVLSKDAGIQEAYEKLENALRESMQIERHWNAILQVTGIDPNTDSSERLKRKLIMSIRTGKAQYFKKALSSLLDRTQEEAVSSGVEKLLAISGIQ